MDFGEDPRQTLTREFYEETGLTPEIGEVVDVLSFLASQDFHVIQIIFQVEARGEPRDCAARRPCPSHRVLVSSCL